MPEKPSKFERSPFLKEGQPSVVWQPEKNKSKPKESEFIQEFTETGRPNWKKAPREVRTRYRGIYLVLLSIPLLLLPSFEMYRRLEGKSTKKVQEGEIIGSKEVRKFDETEKWKTEKDSLMYKLFGKDFFLDGFTSKTMGNDRSNENE